MSSRGTAPPSSRITSGSHSSASVSARSSSAYGLSSTGATIASMRRGAEPNRLGAAVEQRVSLLTLGVSDYGRAKAFYESLGWSAALDVEETAFFQANGCIVVLWAREKLAEDSGIADDGARWGGIALAHNVGSREEVAEIIERARSLGAEITREPSETFYGGYAGV